MLDSTWAFGFCLSQHVSEGNKAFVNPTGCSAFDRSVGGVSLGALWLGTASFGQVFPNHFIQHKFGIFLVTRDRDF